MTPLADIGTAEAGLALGGLTLPILGFFAKWAFSEISQLRNDVTTLKAHNFDQRVFAVERELASLGGDVREVKGAVARAAEDVGFMRRWVEQQADPSRHRRREDPKGQG